MKKVGWQAIAPIFADIVISPWNLLVGGLLIRFLSTNQAIISILIGYSLLAALFIIYGGLGFKNRMQSADLINKCFTSKKVRWIVPAVLAIGQIGWASINIELGGKSLAYIFSSPVNLGILCYAALLVFIGIMDLYKMGIVKLIITISSISLLVYTSISKFSQVSLSSFLLHKPIEAQTLFWGISIVVASLISFVAVTPDFFQSIKSEKDVARSTILGVFIPGVITAFIGCFLFFDTRDFNLIALISLLTFPVFPHLLNVSTNTDGSIAIYTPGLKLQNIFGINLKTGIIISGVISFLLAIFQLSLHLEIWLKILSLLFPPLVGLVLARKFINSDSELKLFRNFALFIYIFSVLLSLLIARLVPSVLISLVLPMFIYFLLNRSQMILKRI